jgi:hypothetical protein
MSGPTTFRKRERERALQQKQKDKAEKRKERKADQVDRPKSSDPNEDPDLAGIVPGPQPVPVWPEDA